MALAGNVATIVVLGEYVDYEGNPIAGQVIFRVPKALRNALADQILIPSAFVATLDANGRFTATLPASDDPDFHETFEYRVEEGFAGGRSFSAVLPSALTYADFDDHPYSFYLSQTYALATGLFYDMTDLAPLDTPEPFVTLAAGSQFGLLEARVTAAEGTVDTTPPTTGIVLSLEYDSLNVQYADYTAMAGGLGSYTLLASSPVLATSAAIANYLAEAQAAQAAAEQSVLDVEALEVRDPHPFVFTGVA